MKVHFVEAHAEKTAVLPDDLLAKLPANIVLAVTSQFVPQLQNIQKQMELKGKQVTLLGAMHSKYDGQILGCGFTKFRYPKNAEAFLYVGDGLFHPKALLFGSELPVFRYDPFAEKWELLDRAIVEKFHKHQKAGLVTFLHRDHIGVLISTKPGQNLIRHARKLKELYPNKKFYLLVSSTIDFTQLGNFPFVECFVNTACNRLMDDYDKFPKPMVNIEDIPGIAIKNP